jgi:hypothetical protein
VLVETLLAKFENVHGRDGQWSARCPAHEDRQASLTIGVGRDGQWLLTCWAGCELDAIVRAVGLNVPDLFPDDTDRLHANGNGNGAPQSLAAMALPTAYELEKYAARLQRSPEALRMVYEAKGWRAPVWGARARRAERDRRARGNRQGARRMARRRARSRRDRLHGR